MALVFAFLRERGSQPMAREMIAHSQLPAGQRLYEQELAARMGISRTPVRQAIRQLEGEGLVSIRANRETIVTDFTPTDVREIYQFRAAIEGMAAALAAGIADTWSNHVGATRYPRSNGCCSGQRPTCGLPEVGYRFS
jgi:DNA-binding transcriptional regulator YhcF (GntR family)